jgi:hypothetical protein
MGEITHAVPFLRRKIVGCGLCVVLPPVFLLRSAAVMTLSANDCRLSPAAKNGWSVRKNPKDPRLVKLLERCVHAASIDVVDSLARVLGVEAADLLKPPLPTGRQKEKSRRSKDA